MKKLAIAALALMISASTVSAEQATLMKPIGSYEITAYSYHDWKSVGKKRITTYCPYCNDGSGHESKSGVYLEDGHCACNWLPMGTKVKIGKKVYTVVDVCGVDETIDIYIDHSDGYCWCNTLEYKEVKIK